MTPIPGNKKTIPEVTKRYNIKISVLMFNHEHVEPTDIRKVPACLNYKSTSKLRFKKFSQGDYQNIGRIQCRPLSNFVSNPPAPAECSRAAKVDTR